MGKTSTHPHVRPAMVAAPAGKSAALAAMAAALALAATPSSVSADDYQYIVSGWPAANASHSANSAACALEARRRTVGNSVGIALRSDKATAFVIYVK